MIVPAQGLPACPATLPAGALPPAQLRHSLGIICIICTHNRSSLPPSSIHPGVIHTSGCHPCPAHDPSTSSSHPWAAPHAWAEAPQVLRKLPNSKRQQQLLPKVLGVFLPRWRKGKPHKYGHKDEKENRVHEALQEKHIVIFKDPNPTESKPPEMRKRETRRKTRRKKGRNQEKLLCLADCGCSANIFKDWFDSLLRVVLRCIFKFLIY